MKKDALLKSMDENVYRQIEQTVGYRLSMAVVDRMRGGRERQADENETIYEIP